MEEVELYIHKSVKRHSVCRFPISPVIFGTISSSMFFFAFLFHFMFQVLNLIFPFGFCSINGTPGSQICEEKAVKKQIQAEAKRSLVQIRNLFAKFAALA
ncbi:hypothetical protein VNO80_28907 [Phaseolus coccineus]|uniref:Uncharacterized protein n=1 Tax=Phaseolus coccineus TaxID=3886 RepID=A0AAN9LAE9_PHACN